MGDIAIRAENLGKQYRIGRKRPRYKRLTEGVAAACAAPLRWWRRRAEQRDRPDEWMWALRNVSFEVQRGEVLGIVGRNGAGKSTLLKVLSRITAPTEGRAEVYGRLGSLLEVGTGFHPELTGRENIYLNGAILGMRRAEIRTKFDDIIGFAEVERFLDTPVKHYSSGMYVRLAFAVAAHLQPEVLLVDEVLAVGDAAFQKKCLGKMGEIGREGRTVLLISHNMASILNLCTRAVLLDHGSTLAEGPPAEVIQRYLAVNRSSGGEVVWPDQGAAPGNDIVRLHAVRVTQEGSEDSTADVDISRELSIHLWYWNLRPGTSLYPALWLRDQFGSFVLASTNAHSVSLTRDPWYGSPHPAGLFHSVCRIPGNFLNEGMYSVTAIVGKDVQDTQILEDQLLSFFVHDTGEMRKEYLGHWIGVVRPKLAWSTELAGADLPAARCA